MIRPGKPHRVKSGSEFFYAPFRNTLPLLSRIEGNGGKASAVWNYAPPGRYWGRAAVGMLRYSELKIFAMKRDEKTLTPLTPLAEAAFDTCNRHSCSGVSAKLEGLAVGMRCHYWEYAARLSAS
jgi:hypothetical protein